jgi:phage terminase large subunit GpA-like protein
MKTVITEMPEIYVDCPHCKEETAVGRVWTSEEQINIDEGDNGITYCDHCNEEFRVHLDF